MQLVTRAQWGARQPDNGHDRVSSNKGVKVHYLGSPYNFGDHSTCAGYMRRVQRDHMDGNGWADFAYNFAVCEHGSVFEGRGLRAQNAANGNTALNRQHFAVLAFVGSSGSTAPTGAQVQGLKEVIAYLRANGAGQEIRGHKDGYATDCPGPALYALVQSGALEPGGSKPDPEPQGLAPFPGAAYFKGNPNSPLITAMGRRLVAEGCSAYAEGPGPRWTDADRRSYAKWQRKLGFTGTDADGWPGASSWAKLRVPRT
ncbi:peptidoglycan-binding protein [Streptomyces sp. NBC_00291]|uniref:peptidoglycan-binding protein n=1 Tax=Streptomyces sp. NBC_00291 TaxID=2975704 RepID=UPI00225BA411|nr:peptidoglycan-binding protein [Streptomyces sp. NBC_00291]MCX5153707.1 peptidoglycan-binding protein [Streptomyces sp. NBC_00291]